MRLAIVVSFVLLRAAHGQLKVVIAEDQSHWLGEDSASVLYNDATLCSKHQDCMHRLKARGCSCSWSKDVSRIGSADALHFYVTPLRSGYGPGGTKKGQYKVPGNRSDYPADQIWSAQTLEPEKHEMLDRVRQHIDIEVSWRRGADVYWSYYPMDSSWKEFKKMPSMTLKQDAEKTGIAPVAAFISSCSTTSKRLEFLEELSRHIRVDSFGQCFNTANETEVLQKLGAPRHLFSIGPLAKKDWLMERYRFVAAFENTLVDDYVTEKFFGALKSGAVPLYRGAPNIEAFVPGNKSIIDATKFASPEALANHLKDVLADGKYESFFAWKQGKPRPFFRDLRKYNHGNWCCRYCEELCLRKGVLRRGDDEDQSPVDTASKPAAAAEGKSGVVTSGPDTSSPAQETVKAASKVESQVREPVQANLKPQATDAEEPQKSAAEARRWGPWGSGGQKMVDKAMWRDDADL
mmetsp:Transcript_62308/g.143488  ORF Transcript_62308/g.143488 Transcript_62308/m.143488 type:complete len:463 (-) Transcript_62308:73-1461(-)